MDKVNLKTVAELPPLFETFGQLTGYIGVDVEYGTAYKATAVIWDMLRHHAITDQEVRALVDHLRGEGDI